MIRTSIVRLLKDTLQRLRGAETGVALTEFAFTFPVLLVLGLYGMEIARMAVSRTQVSQIALALGDNASRIGQTDNSGISPTISESDIDAIIDSAVTQGADIDLLANGRIILTSLEYDDRSDRQYIHWQRCRGLLNRDSRYGDDRNNDGLNDPEITGMGSGAKKATVDSGEALMFVEIVFKYDPLFDQPFGSGTREFRQEAAFLVRDDRNLDPGLPGKNKNSDCKKLR